MLSCGNELFNVSGAIYAYPRVWRAAPIAERLDTSLPRRKMLGCCGASICVEVAARTGSRPVMKGVKNILLF